MRAIKGGPFPLDDLCCWNFRLNMAVKGQYKKQTAQPANWSLQLVWHGQSPNHKNSQALIR